jgi:hypothetical protein
MTLGEVLGALELPAACRVDQRVPKKMLAEHGAPTAADRRLLTDGIEEVQWIAALKPGTVAVPEHRAEEREYVEVAVLYVLTRPSHGKPSQQLRLAELIHRAVPYPVLLVQGLQATDAGAGNRSVTHLALSLVHKRSAQNEVGKVVLDGDLVRLELTDANGAPVPSANALLPAMALERQPHRDLFALYQGWVDCLIAAEAARITGRFDLARDASHAMARLEALRACQRLEREASRIRHQAAKERQMAKLADLNMALQRLQAQITAARAQL